MDLALRLRLSILLTLLGLEHQLIRSIQLDLARPLHRLNRLFLMDLGLLLRLLSQLTLLGLAHPLNRLIRLDHLYLSLLLVRYLLCPLWNL